MLNKPFREWMDGIWTVEKFRSNRPINQFLDNIEITMIIEEIEEEEEEEDLEEIEEALTGEVLIEVAQIEEVDHHHVDHTIIDPLLEVLTTPMNTLIAVVKAIGN